MIPYLQTTPYTTAASSLLTILHHFNPKIVLTKENEFHIWRKTALLPTRASSLYALALIAKKYGLHPRIILEKKEYDYPDYRFHRYKKTDIELACFHSQQDLFKAQQEQIMIEEKSFDLEDIKKELCHNILLLRLNTKLIRNEKNSSHYLIIYDYQDHHFQLIDPALGSLSLPESTLKEAFSTLETKKHRCHRMLVFPKINPQP